MTKFKQFTTNNKAVSLLEFALIFPLFLSLVLAVMEYGIMMYLRGAVEERVSAIARLGITGDNLSGTRLRKDVLAIIFKQSVQDVVLNKEGVRTQVNVFDTLDDLNTGTLSSSANPFGTRNQIVRYRIFYTHNFITPLGNLINGLDNNAIIQSTAFVLNEDF